MERVFTMPDLGEGLEEGQIIDWLVAEGDEITLNQPLVEVDTAKAAVEIPSPFAGRVRVLHGAVGEAVPVGKPLVTFEVGGTREVLTPEPAQVRSREAALERRPSDGQVRATPPVRKLARDMGVDIETLRGSGPEGRVMEDDVRRATRSVAEGTIAVTVRHDQRSERVSLDAHRRAVAENLTVQARIPQVTTFRTVDCTELETLRKGLGLSPFPIVISALCRVIENHPLLNAAWAEHDIELRGKVNVGIAVDTERGLVVPVIQDAGRRGFASLTGELKRLADGARSGTFALEDQVVGATIAVSNTGSYGSEAGTPILSPGTSVTLAFGVIEPRALVHGGTVVARPAATISCTFDHRVLDGAAAGRALTDLVALLESRERLEGLPR
jgi:pyruvate/2-oxoglutarate dehydrogenase complex dihydrolipoamide acyltransferase (E2) component